MKAKKTLLVILLVLGFVSASLSSLHASSGKDNIVHILKTADSTDSNGGGIIIPPIGH